MGELSRAHQEQGHDAGGAQEPRGGARDPGAELCAELLSRGEEVVLRARGSSMAPLLRDGDRLTLAKLSRAPRAGDVLAARDGDRLLVHRVVSTRRASGLGASGGAPSGRQALLRGDALLAPDGWFASQSLTGKLLIAEVKQVRRGERALGAWRLGGLRARLWLFALPAVRLWRGAARRLKPGVAPRPA